MTSLEADLARARELDVADLADAVESIGFECTRCGACCRGDVAEDGSTDPHTATVFPDEVRRLQAAGRGAVGDGDGGATADDAGVDGVDAAADADTDAAADVDTDDDADAETAYDWRDVARPMPFGLSEGPDGPEGETFEWALATDDCGDCTFYAEEDGRGACTVHPDRPLICRTYPFSVALAGTSQPMGEAVDEAGVVRAHECEGLGRDISREEAEDLAATLKARAVRELEEAIAVRENYAPADSAPGEVVVHDSEGAKHADGTPL